MQFHVGAKETGVAALSIDQVSMATAQVSTELARLLKKGFYP